MILTKKQFQKLNNSTSKNFFKKMSTLNNYKYILPFMLKNRIAHQTSWYGEPILQLPQDLFAIQEIIFNSKPDYIIEVGVAWSGSLLFYSSIFHSFQGKKIIGIDTYIPKEIRQRLAKFPKLNKNIILIEGKSTDDEIIKKIMKILGKSKKVFVHLDSDHSHQNVLEELKVYSKFVSKNSYLLCGDTHVEFFKQNPHGKNKNYSKGNNPLTALNDFLKSKDGKKFKQDFQFEDKYFLTLNPKGYLKKIR